MLIGLFRAEDLLQKTRRRWASWWKIHYHIKSSPGYLCGSAGHPGLSTVSDAGKITGCKWLWNYAKVFEYFNLIPNVITSIIVVGGTLIVVSIVVSMAAYAFFQTEFPHKQAVYYLDSYRYDDPYICINLSALSDRKGTSSEQYRMVIGISICHSKCLLLILWFWPTTTMHCRMNWITKIDGANKWTTFIQIMLPIAKPGLVFCTDPDLFICMEWTEWRSFFH